MGKFETVPSGLVVRRSNVLVEETSHDETPYNDVEAHIDKMQGIHDHLSALITPENTLTADHIFATALIVSLPADWLSCVSSLLQSSPKSSTQIFTTLKSEILRRKAASLHEVSKGYED